MSRWPRVLSYWVSHILGRASLSVLPFAAVLILFDVSMPKVAAWQARDLRGSPKDPFKETPGKLIVLVFIRTECPISNRYAPLIQEMSVKYGSPATFWLVFP